MLHSGEEVEGDDGLAMMVPMDLWNEAQEAIESLVGEDDATPQPASEPVPLFLLHSGKIGSDGEQDDWDVEAESGRRVDEFCRRYPGQTIKLYAGPQPEIEPAQEHPK
jgi:hypothetical protein